MEPKITAQEIGARKTETEAKIVAITAYDFTMAKLLDEIVDILLVGDSLGMVVQGEPNTLGVTLDQIIYHCRCVSKATKHAHLVADMPFMSYQISEVEALRNAGRILSEGKAEAVKLEGGVRAAQTVERLVSTGIPVMGHVGLTPQSVHLFGGHRVQGKTDSGRESILQDAPALEDAGAYAVVLEAIPADLAKAITERLGIPTIGIGAGPHCDGQVLVSTDLLGMDDSFHPKFLKRYANLSESVQAAAAKFASKVRKGEFPTLEHSF